MYSFYNSTEERCYKAIIIHSNKHKNDNMTMGAWNPGGKSVAHHRHMCRKGKSYWGTAKWTKYNKICAAH